MIGNAFLIRYLHYLFPLSACFFLANCSYQHWAINEIDQVNTSERSQIAASFEQAVQAKAIRLNTQINNPYEITVEDPLIKMDKELFPFKLFTFHPGDKNTLSIKIITLETEKELLRGMFTGTHETGILLPSVFILDSKGNVVADSLSDLHLEENLIFSSLQFEATLNAELKKGKEYYILVTSRQGKAGSKLNATPWSVNFVKEMLDEDEIERLISLTGMFEIHLSYQ